MRHAKRDRPAKVVVGVLGFCLAATAQMARPHMGGGPPMGPPMAPPSAIQIPPSGLGSGLPPLQPIPPLGNPNFAVGVPYAPRFGGYFPGYGYPGYWGTMAGYPAAQSPVTNVVVIEQPVGVSPAPTATPARPEVREYKFDATPADTSIAAADMQLFVVVTKDGTRYLASAVWAQGTELQFIDETGIQRRIQLATVDRDATKEVNRARNLNLRIP